MIYEIDGKRTTIVRTKCAAFDGVVPDGYKREAFLRHLDEVKRHAQFYAFAVYPFGNRALRWDEWLADPGSPAGGHWITELVVGEA